MSFDAVLFLILLFSAVPALIQLLFCLCAKSYWVKAIPITLMSILWVANIIMALLFSTPLLENCQTFFLGSTSFVVISDQVLIAGFGLFMVSAQALVWLIHAIVQRHRRTH